MKSLVCCLIALFLCAAAYALSDEGEAHVHNWVVASETTATCTEPGVRNLYCTGCSERRSEQTEKARGHMFTGDWAVTKEPTCTASGREYTLCVRVNGGVQCGEQRVREIPALGHDFTPWQTLDLPSDDQAGSQSRACIRCGESEKRSVLSGESGPYAAGVAITLLSSPQNSEYYTPGEQLAYRISVTNTGDTPLTDVSINETAAGEVRSIAYFDVLMPGDAERFTYELTLTDEACAQGAYTLPVECVWTAEDSADYYIVTREISSPVAIKNEIPLPDISIKAVSTPENGRYYKPGEAVRFEITLTNDSDADLSHIKLISEPHADAWLRSAVEYVDTLNAHSVFSCTFDYVLTRQDALDGALSMRALYSLRDHETKPENAEYKLRYGFSGTVSVDAGVGIESNMQVTLTEAGAPANGEYYTQGEWIRYSISIESLSDIPLYDISVIDYYELPGSEAVMELYTSDSLPPYGSFSCEYRHKVKAAEVSDGAYLNRAAVRWAEEPGGETGYAKSADVILPTAPAEDSAAAQETPEPEATDDAETPSVPENTQDAELPVDEPINATNPELAETEPKSISDTEQPEDEAQPAADEAAKKPADTGAEAQTEITAGSAPDGTAALYSQEAQTPDGDAQADGSEAPKDPIADTDEAVTETQGEQSDEPQTTETEGTPASEALPPAESEADTKAVPEITEADETPEVSETGDTVPHEPLEDAPGDSGSTSSEAAEGVQDTGESAAIGVSAEIPSEPESDEITAEAEPSEQEEPSKPAEPDAEDDSDEAEETAQPAPADTDAPSIPAAQVFVSAYIKNEPENGRYFTDGEAVVYGITVVNASESAIDGVSVRLVRGDGSRAETALLAPDSAAPEIELAYTVTAQDVLDGVVDNQAVASVTSADGQPVSAGASEILRAFTAEAPKLGVPDTTAAVFIEASAPANGSFYVPGEKVTYLIALTNRAEADISMCEVYCLNVTTAALRRISGAAVRAHSSFVLSYTQNVTQADVEAGKLTCRVCARCRYADGSNALAYSDGITVLTGSGEPAAAEPVLPVIHCAETSLPTNGAYYTAGETVSFDIVMYNPAGAEYTEVLTYSMLSDAPECLVHRADALSGRPLTIHTEYELTALDAKIGSASNIAWTRLTAADGKKNVVYSNALTLPLTGDLPSQGALYAAFCEYKTLSSGAGIYLAETAYCAEHAAADALAREICAHASTDAETAEALKAVMTLWQSELDTQYERLISGAPDSIALMFRRDQNAFTAWLNEYGLILERACGGDAVCISTAECAALRSQCMFLCALGEGLPDPLAADNLFLPSSRTACACECDFYEYGTPVKTFEICAEHMPMATRAYEQTLEGTSLAAAYDAAAETYMQLLEYICAEAFGEAEQNADGSLEALHAYSGARRALIDAYYPDEAYVASENIYLMYMENVCCLCAAVSDAQND